MLRFEQFNQEKTMCNCEAHTGAKTAAPTAESVTFQVDDMTCAHCAGTITKSLESALPGSAVTIDLPTKRVTVSGDAAKAEAAIATAGYTPLRAVN